MKVVQLHLLEENYSKQENGEIFEFEKKRFKITGAIDYKAFINSKFCLVIALDENEKVYFYTITIQKQEDTQAESKVICREIAKFSIYNFEYFRSFYQKDVMRNIKSQNEFEEYMKKVQENKVDSLYIFKGMMAAVLKENDFFCLKVFGNAWEAFEKNRIAEKITTFFKIGQNEFSFIHIRGNNFKVLSGSIWLEMFFNLKGWIAGNREWILTQNNLRDLRKFQVFNIREFSKMFKNIKATPWRLSQNEDFVFFEEQENEYRYKKALTTDILWNPQSDIVIPSNSEKPALFWHWNKKGIPHVTVEQKEENEVYKIWYREEGQSEFQNIECIRRPIAFYDAWDRHVYFVKTHDSNYMLVLNHRLEIIFKCENVTFFEEISPIKKQSHKIMRTINDKGHYFASSQLDNYELKAQNLLILKSKKEEKERFCIYWNKEKIDIDASVPFVSYQFEKESAEQSSHYKTEVFTINAEVFMQKCEQYSVSILKKEKVLIEE